MHPTVARALEVIALESREPEYTEAFDAAHAVVIEFGEQNLADRLFADIPETVPFQLVAMLFDFLAWQTDDNGSAVTRAVERWLLEGTYFRKIQIALSLDVYPFPNEREMQRVLTEIAESHPQIADKCRQMIKSRQDR